MTLRPRPESDNLFWTREKNKQVSKGISIKWNQFTHQQYLDVLKTQKSRSDANTLFRSTNDETCTLAQQRCGLTYFYPKRIFTWRWRINRSFVALIRACWFHTRFFPLLSCMSICGSTKIFVWVCCVFGRERFLIFWSIKILYQKI